MSFNSLDFLFLFPIVVFLYFVIPKKIRYVWLLIASYYFYMSWNVKYAGLLAVSTCVTYLGGLLLGRLRKNDQAEGKRRKYGSAQIILILCLLINLGILFFFKYYDFAFTNIISVFGKFGIQVQCRQFDVLLPVGISFYTFQAIGYMIDVYRGETRSEKNILKYALFVSFFPQLVAGPIERSKNLLKQLEQPTTFQVANARSGLFTMAYGLFLKMVVADNIGKTIDSMLPHYYDYHGTVIAACIVLFAFQIYCDFHGYTQIAIGSAKVLGYELQENFKAPYMAGNIKEFWRSWHISLTTWFTDYLYIPLGGNRKGKVRKYINTMICFLVSGLWHGAAWSFAVWGGINGFYLCVYDMTKNMRARLCRGLRINTSAVSWKILIRGVTFLIVDYAWLYFRAGSITSALRLQKYIFQDFHPEYIFCNEFWMMFGDVTNVLVILFSIMIVMALDYLQYKGIDWKERILDQQIVFRWMIYFMLLFVIFMNGVYGIGNEQTQFIYFQF